MSYAEENVRSLLIEYTGLPQKAITGQSHLIYDLGFDSLEFAELIMQIEDKFKIIIPTQDTHLLLTVDKIIEYLERLMSKS